MISSLMIMRLIVAKYKVLQRAVILVYILFYLIIVINNIYSDIFSSRPEKPDAVPSIYSYKLLGR